MKDKIRIESIDLSELYPDLETGRPVTTKLRTLLRQVDLKIDTQNLLENNSYLNRLVTECKLFLPEMFQSRWKKNWEFPLAGKIKGTLIKSSADLIISPEQEITIVDWSGVEMRSITLAQAGCGQKSLVQVTKSDCPKGSGFANRHITNSPT